MTLTTFTIDSNTYSAYATVAQASAYLRPEQTLWGAWNLLTDTDKQLRLIQATRRIDALSWGGEKAVATQGTEWPREGLQYADGSDVPDNVIPTQIETAVIWLAGNVRLPLSPVADLGVDTADVASRTVGPRSTSYWHRRRSALERQMPDRIRQLVGLFLASTYAVGEPTVSFDGVEESGFRDLHERSEGIA